MTVPPGPPPLPWKFRAAPERWLLVSAAAAAGTALAIVFAARYLHLPWVCAWRGLTGLPCAGCGGTRAAVLLLHGEIWRALALNPGVVIGAVALSIAAVYAATVLAFRSEPWRPRLAGWRWLLAAAVLANWLYLLTVSRP